MAIELSKILNKLDDKSLGMLTREAFFNIENRELKSSIVAHNLLDAFNWGDTPQGHGYWSEVYRNLNGGIFP